MMLTVARLCFKLPGLHTLPALCLWTGFKGWASKSKRLHLEQTLNISEGNYTFLTRWRKDYGWCIKSSWPLKSALYMSAVFPLLQGPWPFAGPDMPFSPVPLSFFSLVAPDCPSPVTFTCDHLHFWKLPCIFLDSIPVESFCEAFFDHNGFSYLWTHKVFIFCGELGGRNPEGFQELSSVASVRPTRNKGIRPQGTEPTPSHAAWGPSAGERLHESLPVACRLEKSPVLPKVSSVMSYSAVSHNRKWSAFLIHKLRHRRGWRVPGCISWSPREQPLFPSLHGSDSSCSYTCSVQIRLRLPLCRLWTVLSGAAEDAVTWRLQALVFVALNAHSCCSSSSPASCLHLSWGILKFFT